MRWFDSYQIPNMSEQGDLEFSFACIPMYKVSVGCQRSGNHLLTAASPSAPDQCAWVLRAPTPPVGTQSHHALQNTLQKQGV